jgi:DNA topoisomerase-1
MQLVDLDDGMAKVTKELPQAVLQSSTDLIYVSSIEGGITRKPGKKSFLYYNAGGDRIRDPQEIGRFSAMAIPPAYTDVVISANPNSHLQAIGIDARGRKQYRYHPDWSAERGRAKFEKLSSFADSLPEIRERVDRDLA